MQWTDLYVAAAGMKVAHRLTSAGDLQSFVGQVAPGPDADDSDRDGSDRAGSDRSGSDRDGSDQGGSDRDGSDRDGSDRDGSDRDGSDQGGSDRDPVGSVQLAIGPDADALPTLAQRDGVWVSTTPMPETVKDVAADGLIQATVPREQLAIVGYPIVIPSTILDGVIGPDALLRQVLARADSIRRLPA